MLKKICVSFVALFVFTVITAHAQTLPGYLRKKQQKVIESATKRADKEVDKKIDEEVNKGIDKLLDDASKDLENATDSINSANTESKPATDEQRPSEQRFESAMGNFMKSVGVGTEVKHEDVYDFKSHMKMLIEQTNENGSTEKPVYYNTFFNEGGVNYGMEFNDDEGNLTTFVFDGTNFCTLILMNDGSQKTGIATSMNEAQMKQLEAEAEAYVDEEAEKENYNLKKTGRTKTINGFKCEEYKAEDDQTLVSVWVTNDLKGKVNKSMYKNQYFGSSFWLAEQTDGVVIQYESKSKVDKEQMVMTVEKVDFNANKKISTGEYTITGISIGGSQQ